MPSQNLKTLIKSRLNNAQKVAVLGIGSTLRGDDAAGIIASEELLKLCPEKKYPNFKVLLGENAPENVTGVIKSFNPTHLICIDAADTSEEPGTISMIDYETIGGISFSTHTLPLKVMLDYLKSDSQMEVIVIGIQPEHLNFGKKPSKRVASSAKQAAKDISSVIKSIKF